MDYVQSISSNSHNHYGNVYYYFHFRVTTEAYLEVNLPKLKSDGAGIQTQIIFWFFFLHYISSSLAVISSHRQIYF